MHDPLIDELEKRLTNKRKEREEDQPDETKKAKGLDTDDDEEENGCTDVDMEKEDGEVTTGSERSLKIDNQDGNDTSSDETGSTMAMET